MRIEQIPGNIDFNFCDRKNRCRVCGGELGEYEKENGYTDHSQRSFCVMVLQNTLKGRSETDDKIIEELEKRIFELEENKWNTKNSQMKI